MFADGFAAPFLRHNLFVSPAAVLQIQQPESGRVTGRQAQAAAGVRMAFLIFKPEHFLDSERLQEKTRVIRIGMHSRAVFEHAGQQNDAATVIGEICSRGLSMGRSR